MSGPRTWVAIGPIDGFTSHECRTLLGVLCVQRYKGDDRWSAYVFSRPIGVIGVFATVDEGKRAAEKEARADIEAALAEL